MNLKNEKIANSEMTLPNCERQQFVARILFMSSFSSKLGIRIYPVKRRSCLFQPWFEISSLFLCQLFQFSLKKSLSTKIIFSESFYSRNSNRIWKNSSVLSEAQLDLAVMHLHFFFQFPFKDWNSFNSMWLIFVDVLLSL